MSQKPKPELGRQKQLNQLSKEELVEKDDCDWYPRLQLLYYLTVGNKYLSERDRRSLLKFSEQGNKAFKPDISKQSVSSQIMALKLLGIEKFLDPSKEFCQTNLAQFLARAIKMRFDVKTILRVTINPDKDSAIAVAQRILRKLGAKLEFKCWRGNRASRQRIYSGCELDPDDRKKIFNYWLSMEDKAITNATT